VQVRIELVDSHLLRPCIHIHSAKDVLWGGLKPAGLDIHEDPTERISKSAQCQAKSQSRPRALSLGQSQPAGPNLDSQWLVRLS
jgi:hypothetical protein